MEAKGIDVPSEKSPFDHVDESSGSKEPPCMLPMLLPTGCHTQLSSHFQGVLHKSEADLRKPHASIFPSESGKKKSMMSALKEAFIPASWDGIL